MLAFYLLLSGSYRRVGTDALSLLDALLQMRHGGSPHVPSAANPVSLMGLVTDAARAATHCSNSSMCLMQHSLISAVDLVSYR